MGGKVGLLGDEAASDSELKSQQISPGGEV
jgi:hypothetical protein